MLACVTLYLVITSLYETITTWLGIPRHTTFINIGVYIMSSNLKVVAPQAKKVLSTEVSEALKQAGEATYNSDQAVGLSKRANKNAALALKKAKVHSDRLSSSYFKENPDDPIRTEVMMNLLSGKPAEWAHYYHAFDNDKESLSKSIREKEVFVGYDKDGEELFKSEYDAASHFRGQIISQLGAIARAMRKLENIAESKQGTRRELHATWIRTILNDFHADEHPSGYPASDEQEMRFLTDLKNAYKYPAGEAFKPKM